jgi:flagellar biosynthesis/type III secretory pathway protein FliH
VEETSLSRERIRIPAPVHGANLVTVGAEDTLDVVVRRERQRAFEAGLAEGRRAERAEACLRLDEAVERLEAAQHEAGDELAGTAVELATAIARTILLVEIGAGNYDLEKMVRQTLSEAGVGRSTCIVHLNPTDHARLAGVKFRTGTTLQADEGVEAGEVHVETSLGLLVREAVGAVDTIAVRLREELP